MKQNCNKNRAVGPTCDSIDRKMMFYFCFCALANVVKVFANMKIAKGYVYLLLQRRPFLLSQQNTFLLQHFKFPSGETAIFVPPSSRHYLIYKVLLIRALLRAPPEPLYECMYIYAYTWRHDSRLSVLLMIWRLSFAPQVFSICFGQPC